MRWSLCLFPFAMVYDTLTRWRNHLYDRGIRPSVSFEANVIAVGNLSAGGTGKTPLVNRLVDHFLIQKRTIAVLSRGYGRRTRGYRLADKADGPDEIGDEPALMMARYGSKISVAVCEERVIAIPRILSIQPDNEVIILDDAFQHRTIVPSFSIMLTTYQAPFYQDHLMPVGRLREARRGAMRADAILVTGCPDSVAAGDMTDMRQNIERYAPGVPVFFTNVHYEGRIALTEVGPDPKVSQRVLAIAGVARPDDFFDYLTDHHEVVGIRRYRDHKYYDWRLIHKLDEEARRLGSCIVLTEKDAVKWRPYRQKIRSTVYYQPIRMGFVQGEDEFLDLVDSSIEKYQREY